MTALPSQYLTRTWSPIRKGSGTVGLTSFTQISSKRFVTTEAAGSAQVFSKGEMEIASPAQGQIRSLRRLPHSWPSCFQFIPENTNQQVISAKHPERISVPGRGCGGAEKSRAKVRRPNSDKGTNRITISCHHDEGLCGPKAPWVGPKPHCNELLLQCTRTAPTAATRSSGLLNRSSVALESSGVCDKNLCRFRTRFQNHDWPEFSSKSLNFLLRDGWRSLHSAFASIWRMLSPVMENRRPTSSRVCSLPSSRPNRMRMICFS